ncbi:MAG: DUF2628 domain-containing protein [Oscillospiraceae bacterium]|jgi:uncharacterized Zn finger protein (UPF0148 family)|nr:DUF2628 domain-containing protein [Oscillospiraceae bacterium]
MRYENEPCVWCRQGLHPDEEDVVVCPDCGAPQHKECWKANGGCAYHAEHGDYLWKPSVEPTEPEPSLQNEPNSRICPVCGSPCKPETAVCPTCGTDFLVWANEVQERAMQMRLPPQEMPPLTVNGRTLHADDEIDGCRVEEIGVHVRGSLKKVERYAAVFEKNRLVGWNWAAFFFGTYWFFFRKIWRPALLLAGISLVVLLALNPLQNALYEKLLPVQESYTESFNAAVETNDTAEVQAAVNTFLTDVKQVLKESRLYIGLNIGFWVVLHLCCGLFGDKCLRDKIWKDILDAHEDTATVKQESDRQGIRARILLRKGGPNFFAPLLYFTAFQTIPMWLITLFDKLLT